MEAAGMGGRGGGLTFCSLDSVWGGIGGPLHGGSLAPQVPHGGRQGVQPALALAHQRDVRQVGAALPQGGAQKRVGAHLQQERVLGDGLSGRSEQHPVAVAVHLQMSIFAVHNGRLFLGRRGRGV